MSKELQAKTTDLVAKTAGGKTFHDFLKKAQADFMGEVAKIVNAKQKYVKAKLAGGVSTSFVSFEGVDTSDIELEGFLWLIMLDEHTVKYGVQIDKSQRGRHEEERTLKTGEVDAEMIARLLYPFIGPDIR